METETPIYQISFILVGLVLLFYLIYLVYRKQTAIIEPDEITDAINNAVNSAVNAVKQGLEDAFNSVVNAMMGPINKIIDFFNDVVNFFESFPDRFKNIGNAFTHFGTTFKQAFDNLGSELKGGFDGIGDSFLQSYNILGAELDKEVVKEMGRGFKELDDVIFDDKNKGLIKLFSSIGKLITDIKFLFNYVKDFFGVYIYGYIKCGIDKILNSRKCFIFYTIDLLAGIFFYLPVNTICFLLNYIFCINTTEYMNYLMNKIECLDENARPFLGGYSLVHYSPSIIAICYSCQDLSPLPKSPLDIFEADARDIKASAEQIPLDVKNSLNRISFSMNRIPGAFNNAFELLGYQLKASLEQIGSSFPDSMNVLKNQMNDVGHDFKQQFQFKNVNDLRWKDKDFSATINVPFYYKSVNKPKEPIVKSQSSTIPITSKT